MNRNHTTISSAKGADTHTEAIAALERQIARQEAQAKAAEAKATRLQQRVSKKPGVRNKFALRNRGVYEQIAGHLERADSHAAHANILRDELEALTHPKVTAPAPTTKAAAFFTGIKNKITGVFRLPPQVVAPALDASANVTPPSSPPTAQVRGVPTVKRTLPTAKVVAAPTPAQTVVEAIETA
jgi:hypothetical protein